MPYKVTSCKNVVEVRQQYRAVLLSLRTGGIDTVRVHFAESPRRRRAWVLFLGELFSTKKSCPFRNVPGEMFSRLGNNRKTFVIGKHPQSSPSNRVCGISCIKYILFGAVFLLSVGLIWLNKYVFTTTTARTSSYPFRRVRNKKQPESKQNDREPKLQITRGDQAPKGVTPICDVPTVMDAIPLIRSKTHIVQPPRSPFTLVCCQTTQGSLSIAVHPHWAPRGAHRFLSMVESWYFSSKVPFFRCLKGFICQFGIAGDPKFNDKDIFDFSSTMLDDPNWLPEGPEGRVRDGKFRFSKGYLAYAGSGPNSRSNQFIVALEENKFLGGGSPWEVPFGEIIGESSLNTLDKLYTGYDEKGPSQARLYREGTSKAITEKFPKLDYILSCDVIEESSSW